MSLTAEIPQANTWSTQLFPVIDSHLLPCDIVEHSLALIFCRYVDKGGGTNEFLLNPHNAESCYQIHPNL